MAGEEEGSDFNGYADITLSVMCSTYEDALDAGSEPQPHRRTDDGMIHRMSLAPPTEQDVETINGRI